MENVILIGMPASGKSTAGVLLAKRTGRSFIDCDLLLQQAEGALLGDILARAGAEGFIAAEERVNASLSARGAVIATGGSAVYGERAMAHLRRMGKVVYLRVAEEELERRLRGRDIFRRGVVMRARGETLAELYAERAPLYEKYADAVADCTGTDLEGTVRAILAALGEG